MDLFYNMYISFSVMLTLLDRQPSPSRLYLTIMTEGHYPSGHDLDLTFATLEMAVAPRR
jgi:hypothetical protein